MSEVCSGEQTFVQLRTGFIVISKTLSLLAACHSLFFGLSPFAQWKTNVTIAYVTECPFCFGNLQKRVMQVTKGCGWCGVTAFKNFTEVLAHRETEQHKKVNAQHPFFMLGTLLKAGWSVEWHSSSTVLVSLLLTNGAETSKRILFLKIQLFFSVQNTGK